MSDATLAKASEDYMTHLARAIRRAAFRRGVAKLGDDLALYRLYAVLAQAKGTAVTAEDVHDAWSSWEAGRDPGHRSLRPFDELNARVRKLDEPFAAAIREVARERGLGKGAPSHG